MSAFEAGAELADCMRERASLGAARHLLVVAIEAVDGAELGEPARDCTLYRLPDSAGIDAGASHEPWLPFGDEAFDGVVLYRVTPHNVDMTLLLGEAARVLRPAGRIVVLERRTDFAFAPLPEAGPGHLLHGWLRDAGFADVDISERGGSQVIAVAHA